MNAANWLKMLTIYFQSMSYLLAALACITLTHSLESSGIDDMAPFERKNQNIMDDLMRISHRFGKSDHIFGRTARNYALQTSPLIRFGKRYVLNDGRSEALSNIL
ncbi:hypothetical protein ACH3XW_49815 [Acanthocheilonema viteae]